jgi:hypothetical protein
VKDIHIYFEGDALLRPGFRKFFSQVIEAARKQNRSVSPIATNGTPIRDFGIAQRKSTNSINLLVLDSEQQLDGTALRHQQAAGFPPDRIFWMVELMESWFLADREAVKRYYNDERFQESSLPANAQVEKIPKKDVLDGLKEATRRTQKGRYHKTKHAPGILETINPDKVTASAPQCRRLFDVLNGLLTDEGG